MSPQAIDFNTIDRIIADAIEQMKAAKEALFSFRSAEESLASEKTRLTSIVGDLRSEKTQLSLAIENMDSDYGDLGDEIASVNKTIRPARARCLDYGTEDNKDYKEHQCKNVFDGVNCATTDVHDDFNMFLDSQDTLVKSNDRHHVVGDGLAGACCRENREQPSDTFVDDDKASVST
eukprot:CAMPEP_0117066600 /NCGR_PEP_ID=MMETSP0472-20121206/46588_1 /TAXON_ID=693140 ORGANISM="Tiarina fusus, Strain LIS" /NCGR_SAMPLE_ID=MMETSP0472 /ASSEMBLY_ACC=CAM_ASM_000603 /LENGTH=176 /DNA_ID=CAMNT_0004787747 /DNA_START=56 /DNA_END=582 /DNA_ORIENTATION=+